MSTHGNLLSRVFLHIKISATRVKFQILLHSLTVIALISIVGTTAYAQSNAIQDFDNWKSQLNGIGIAITHGHTRYDESTQRLTVPEVEVTFSSKIVLDNKTIEKYEAALFIGFPDTPPEISFDYKFSAKSIVYSGINNDSNRISFDSIEYSDDSREEYKLELASKGSLQLLHKLTGTSFQNTSFLIPNLPNRPSESGTAEILNFINHWYPDSIEIGNSLKNSFEISLYSSESKESPLFYTTSEHNNVQMFNLKDGILDKLILEDNVENYSYLDYERNNSTLTTQESTIESVTYKNFNLTGWLELILPISHSNDRINLFEESRSKNYQSNDDGDTFSADEILLKGISYERKDIDLLGIILIFMTSKLYNEEVLAFDFFDLIRGIGIDSINIQNIESKIHLLEDNSTLQLNLDRVVAENLSSSKFGEISVHGFKSQDSISTGTINFDKFSIGNLVFPELEPMKPYLIGTKLEDIEEGGFETVRVFLPRSLQIELKNLDVNIPNANPAERIKFELGSFYHYFETKIPPIPTTLYLEVKDFEVPVNLLDAEDAQEFLTSSGIETLSISHNLDFKWNEKTDEATIENLEIEVSELGRLTASLQLDGIPKSLIENPFTAYQLALISILFNKAEIKFEDYGLTDIALAKIAEEDNVSQEIAKNNLVQLIIEELNENIGNDELQAAFDEEITKFLNDPKSFVLSLSPEQPVPIAQLFGSLIAPATLPVILNATVKANE